MGASWRIAVDSSERTDLVTTGVFAHVRNPIFTAMVLAQFGMVLLVPTWISTAALLALVVAVQLQVRVIEEPYLRLVHGDAYAAYVEQTGRFIPGVGRDQHRKASPAAPWTVSTGRSRKFSSTPAIRAVPSRSGRMRS